MYIANHLALECKFNQPTNLLQEWHGVFPREERMVNKIYDAILAAVTPEKTHYELEIPFEKEFIKGVKVVVNIENPAARGYIHTEGTYTKNGYLAEEIPTIIIDYSGNPRFLCLRLKSTLAHELTHIYEDVRRGEKYGSIADVYQFKNNEPPRNSIDKVAFQLIYFFHSVEQNAYIASFKEQLDTTNIKNNPHSLYKMIENTELWQHFFLPAFQMVNNIDNYDHEALLEAFNRRCEGEHFTTFTQLKKWLIYKANKCQRKLEKTLSKMAYDKLNGLFSIH